MFSNNLDIDLTPFTKTNKMNLRYKCKTQKYVVPRSKTKENLGDLEFGGGM